MLINVKKYLFVKKSYKVTWEPDDISIEYPVEIWRQTLLPILGRAPEFQRKVKTQWTHSGPPKAEITSIWVLPTAIPALLWNEVAVP